MRLESFISDLLFHHDCVVLPGFGGLVANYKSAKLNSHTHIVYPPSKQIAFNRNLTSGDGLLINHVAGILALDYMQAKAMVDKEITFMREQLAANGRMVLDKIGLFYYDNASQLQFIPDEQENYLLASFGLKPIQLKPAIVKPMVETVLKPADPVKVVKMPSGWKVAAAIAIPLLVGGSIWVSSHLNSLEHFSFNSLNPFKPGVKTATYLLNTTDTDSIIDRETNESQEQEIDFSKLANVTTIDFVSGRVSENGIRITDDDNIKWQPALSIPKQDETKKQPTGKYHVIGGAFRIKENAQNFLNALRTEGFDAKMAGRKDDLYLVAYGSYNSIEEARNALQNIRSVNNKHAWLKRN